MASKDKKGKKFKKSQKDLKPKEAKKHKPPISAKIIDSEDLPNHFQIYEDRILPVNTDPLKLTVAELKAFPLINDPSVVSGVIPVPYGGAMRPIDAKTLWAYVRSSPEVVAIFSAIVEDILSDGWRLEGGRNKTMKAEDFLMQNNAKEVFSAMLWDALATGDGFIYKKALTRGYAKAYIEEIVKLYPFKSKPFIKKRMWEEIKNDEDIFSPRGFIDIASETIMRISYDMHGDVINYHQIVGSQRVDFIPEEIVHFRLFKLQGRVYGFTPLVSIARELDILANVKDYARYYFEKGGIPNFMFILKGESPNSPTYKRFEAIIRQFSNLSNKYKNIVMTGDVTAERLNELNKDMEFRELARYLTQIIVMVWGVPSTRLSDLLIARGVRGATVNTEGYYRKISHLQDLIEDLINNELLEEFGVKLKFNRTYKQDEIREVTIDKIMTDTSEQRMRLGLWTKQAAAKYLRIADEDMPEEGEEENVPPAPSQFGQQQPRQFQMLGETEDLAQARDKQIAATEGKGFTRTFESIPLNELERFQKHPEIYDGEDEER